MKRLAFLAAALVALAPAAPAAAGRHGAQVISTSPSVFATRYVVVNQGEIAILRNLDQTFPHDVISDNRTPDGGFLFHTRNILSFGKSEPILGVDKLEEGDYTFTCSVHPAMFGMLLVRERPAISA